MEHLFNGLDSNHTSISKSGHFSKPFDAKEASRVDLMFLLNSVRTSGQQQIMVKILKLTSQPAFLLVFPKVNTAHFIAEVFVTC